MHDYEYIKYLAAKRADAIERRQRRRVALRRRVGSVIRKLSIIATMLKGHVSPKRTEWHSKTTASKT